MTSYTTQQRILFIELCHENRRSMKSIFRKFHKLYGLYNRFGGKSKKNQKYSSSSRCKILTSESVVEDREISIEKIR